MSSYSIVLTGADGERHDITSKTRAANLDRSLGESAASLELDCFDIDANHVMDEVTITVDGVLRFAGVVKEQDDNRNDVQRVTRISCVDNTDRLHRRLVAAVYENQTIKQILLDLIAQFAPWVDTSPVNNFSGTIETIRFDYDTLGEAIQKLADIAGAYWYLDHEDKLHFFATYDGVAAIDFDATRKGSLPGIIIRNSFQLRTTAVDLANRVWVIGAKSSAGTYTDQYWTGDGQNDVFTLAYEPNYPEVWEDGEPKTIEVEKGASSSKDYTYDKKNRVLKRTAGPLPAGMTLRFRYRPTVQIIDYFEDTGSVATYGLYEKAIRDKKITDRGAARKRGREALKRTKGLVRIPSWQSRTWALNPGQLTSITVPSFGFTAQCRINRVSVSFTPQDIIASYEAEEVLN
ncbi:hypothetical protein COLU111180_12000 [Cohnella lubricantis]|uniref:Phage tail protein n=1 Tax=Cohnella lubricantis TaxID=2163172 RepID=A0A841T7E8_9BACL|nr:hypothetical protein [Cohnella lubricantis]MBB6675976.1 hypothetical protein [Cohnella lubricantis]MBP2117905.1 hypothetical protein [Cohnella lubricantis]